jgi:hypothetical protein
MIEFCEWNYLRISIVWGEQGEDGLNLLDSLDCWDCDNLELIIMHTVWYTHCIIMHYVCDIY